MILIDSSQMALISKLQNNDTDSNVSVYIYFLKITIYNQFKTQLMF